MIFNFFSVLVLKVLNSLYVTKVQLSHHVYSLDCLHDLRSQLDDIGDRTGARDADLDFLKSFLTDPVVQKIAQVKVSLHH